MLTVCIDQHKCKLGWLVSGACCLLPKCWQEAEAVATATSPNREIKYQPGGGGGACQGCTAVRLYGFGSLVPFALIVCKYFDQSRGTVDPNEQLYYSQTE